MAEHGNTLIGMPSPQMKMPTPITIITGKKIDNCRTLWPSPASAPSVLSTRMVATSPAGSIISAKLTAASMTSSTGRHAHPVSRGPSLSSPLMKMMAPTAINPQLSSHGNTLLPSRIGVPIGYARPIHSVPTRTAANITPLSRSCPLRRPGVLPVAFCPAGSISPPDRPCGSFACCHCPPDPLPIQQ